MFGSSIVIYDLFIGPNIFSKCGDWMNSFLLIYDFLWFVIFVVGGRGTLLYTYSYVASPYMIFGSSMNLHSGCSLAVALPSVWGQVIYMLLVSFFNSVWACRPQCIAHCCYTPSLCLLCQSYFSWNYPIYLIQCELYPPVIMALIYYAVVIYFSPVISNGSEMNRFSLSLMNYTWLLVAVRRLNFKYPPKM